MLLVLLFYYNILNNSDFNLVGHILFKAHYSTGRVAASFTSTAMVPVLEHEAAILEENEIRYERLKKKGVYIKYLILVVDINKS